MAQDPQAEKKDAKADVAQEKYNEVTVGVCCKFWFPATIKALIKEQFEKDPKALEKIKFVDNNPDKKGEYYMTVDGKQVDYSTEKPINKESPDRLKAVCDAISKALTSKKE